MIERRVKFIAKDDERITSQVDGYGAGFPHLGIRAVADSMGWNQPGAVSFGTDNITSKTLKAWNGMPEVIGWLITVDVDLCAQIATIDRVVSGARSLGARVHTETVIGGLTFDACESFAATLRKVNARFTCGFATDHTYYIRIEQTDGD